MKKIIVLVLCVSMLALTGCASHVEAPIKDKAVQVRDLIQKTTGLACLPIGYYDDMGAAGKVYRDNLTCDLPGHEKKTYEQSVRGSYSPVEIVGQYDEEKTKKMEVSFVTVRTGNFDQDKMLALFGGFGFSKEDVEHALGGQRITRKGITLVPAGGSEVNIFDQ
jgi:hypothetical protein